MFPMTLTLHSSEQLHAVLCALQPLLDAQARPGAYTEAMACVDRAQALADTGETPATEVAAAQVEKPKTKREAARAQASTASAPSPVEPTNPPAPTSPTAGEVKAGARAKTADAYAPTAEHAAAAPPPSTAAVEPVAYDTVAAAITRLAKTDRAHVVATLARFGVKAGPALRPDQYADFLAALTEGVPS